MNRLEKVTLVVIGAIAVFAMLAGFYLDHLLR